MTALLKITVLPESALSFQVKFFFHGTVSFRKLTKPYTRTVMIFVTGQNTTNCLLICVEKDEGRKINVILKCNAIHPVILSH